MFALALTCARLLRALLFVLVAATWSAAGGAPVAAATGPGPAPALEPATLHLANRPILTLQTAFLGMGPA